MISPQSLMMTVLLTDPDLEPSFSNFLTTAKLTPISANFPNTTCLPIYAIFNSFHLSRL